jgi:hypothetical protein
VSVRIKRPPNASPPRELLVFGVERWAPADIDPRDAWRSTRAHEVWCAARAAWVAAGGVWPGGEGQRELGEAVVMPDEPFDTRPGGSKTSN